MIMAKQFNFQGMNKLSLLSAATIACSLFLSGHLSAQTLSKSEVPAWLKGKSMEDTDGIYDWSEKNFRRLAGDKESYTSKDLVDFKPPKLAEPKSPTMGWQPVSIKIRENFDDVLAAEDPSQDGKDQASDINGASLSFSRDLIKNEDTWQGKGSVILPLIWQGSDTSDNWEIENGGLTPSVSFEKLITEGDDSEETDSLVYRVGGFLNVAGPLAGDGRMENRIRGYFSYGTDTDQEVSIPAGELEWEPRLDWGNPFTIGHWRVAKWRSGYAPESSDFNKQRDALLAYQWRIFFKGQFGEVSDAADSPGLTEGSFARVGVITELKLDPFFLQKLSINTRYQYLAALDGPDASPDRFDASIAWTLWEDEAENRRVSIKATYVNGPLDFREENEESLLIGFGITY